MWAVCFSPLFLSSVTPPLWKLWIGTLWKPRIYLFKTKTKKSRDERERGRDGWGAREGWKEKCGNSDRWAVSCWTSLHLPHLFTPVLIKSTEMRIFPSRATYFPARSPHAASIPCCTWVQVGWCQRPLISPPRCQLLMRVSQGGARTLPAIMSC